MRKPITTIAAFALSCAIISVAGCNTDVRDGQSPWFERGSADATDTPPEQRQVLIRSTEDETEGVVLDDDTDIEIADGQFQRPSPDQWKPVSGLGQIQGLELLKTYGEDALVDLRRESSPRVGIVQAEVREGEPGIELREPAFQTCRTAKALGFRVAPRASDECYYIDGEVVPGQMDVEFRGDGSSLKSPALTASFGSETPERADYQCTVGFEDNREIIRPAEKKFRVRIESFPTPLLRSEGSVESTCKATSGETTSPRLRVDTVSGWASGADIPGIELVNIAVRLQVSASPGEDGDAQASRTISFWTNIDSEAVPFSVD